MKRIYKKTVTLRQGVRKEKHEIICTVEKPVSHKPDEWVRQISWIDREIGIRDGGYHTNDITVTFCKDGSMFFSNCDRDGIIVYLYPEQVEAFHSILKQKKTFTP